MTPTWTRIPGRPRTLLVTALTLLLVAAGCSSPGGGGSGPDLSIGQPTGGSSASGTVDVTGTVSAPAGVESVVVRVNDGAPRTCSVGGGGFTCADVPLASGTNTITVIATDTEGRTASASVTVTVDGALAVAITAPMDGRVVQASAIDVRGSVQGADSVTVAVNGGGAESCAIAGGRFVCSEVSLSTGDNTIVVTAESGGETVQDSVTVIQDDAAPGVDITEPTDGTTIAGDTVTVRGDLSHTDAIDTVVAWTPEGSVGCSFTATEFECTDVPVTGSSTTIEVVATDDGGAAGSDFVEILRTAPSEGGFEISLVFFDESYTPSQKDAFQEAADQWAGVVTNDLQDFDADYGHGEACLILPTDDDPDDPEAGVPAIDRTVDDLLIFVTSFTDAELGLLGLASPCLTRSTGPDAGTNAIGYMEFDTEDLDALESDGQLVETIVHEMGHVLGIGTNWEDTYHDLLDYDTIDDEPCQFTTEGFDEAPVYTGSAGRAAYANLGGSGNVPVEDEGGVGTQCGHWDEQTFGPELMTGWLDEGTNNPLSRLTIRSLIDIGYDVDLSQAEPYSLPPSLRVDGTRTGYPIGQHEILIPPHAGVDPETGEIVPLPDRR